MTLQKHKRYPIATGPASWAIKCPCGNNVPIPTFTNEREKCRHCFREWKQARDKEFRIVYLEM